MNKITYYDILGVSQKATLDQIKEAYRRKAKEIHPDLNKSKKDANEKMVWLNKAFQTLSDPVKRIEYDLKLENLNSSYNKSYNQNHSYQQQHQTYNSYQNKTNNNSYNNQSQTKNNNTQQSATKKSNKWRNAFFILLVIVVYGLFTQQSNGSTDVSKNNNVANNIPSQIISPTDTPYPSVDEEQTYTPNYYAIPTEPQIDCTGPDGKHFQTTQEECNAFNAAWAPTPTPYPVSYYGY